MRIRGRRGERAKARAVLFSALYALEERAYLLRPGTNVAQAVVSLQVLPKFADPKFDGRTAMLARYLAYSGSAGSNT